MAYGGNGMGCRYYQARQRVSQACYEILLTMPDVGDAPDSIDVSVDGRIEFRNVNFSYPDGGGTEHRTPTLSNLTLDVPRGTALGITGSTASGKTTLLKLLMRIIEPAEGQIFIDGIDVIRKIGRAHV